MASDYGEDAFGLSEKKRTEALGCIGRARHCDGSSDIDGAQREVTKAWHALEEALEICPENHRARSLLVSCAMNADDYPRAKVEALRIYHDLSEDQLKQLNDSALHLSITHTSKMLGEPEDAIKFATEATELFPKDPQPYMVLGELHMASDNHGEAEQCFRQTLMYNDSPSCKHLLNDRDVYFTLCCLGAALANQAKYTEAEMFLQKASRQDPSSTLGLSTLVDVYHYQGRHSEAMEIAKRIFELDPNDEEIQMKIEDILDSQSDSQTLASSPRPRLSQSHQTRPRQPEPVGVSDVDSVGSCPEKARGPGRSSAESVSGSDRGRPAEIDQRHRQDVLPTNYQETMVPPMKTNKSGQKDDSCLSFFCLERFDEKQPV